DYVTTFTANGSDLYAAIWVHGASSSQCSFGRTASQYQSDFNSLASQGYRLAAVGTSMSGSTLLYSAVFRTPFGQPWYNYSGISSANFSGETLNSYYTGYRPSFVSVYTNNNATVYNATWTYNGGMDPAAAQPIYNAVDDYMRTNNVPGLSLAITVRHLLSNTSGWTDDGQVWNNAYGADHAAIIGWQLDNDNPTQAPGTFYQYQNIDFVVAGRVIEALSGQTYEHYVQNQVQAP